MTTDFPVIPADFRSNIPHHMNIVFLRWKITEWTVFFGSRYVYVTLALIIMGMSGFLSIHAALRMTNAVSAVVDASKRREAVLTFLSYLKDVERGQRGYLLTGDEAYLQPYIIGRASTIEMFNRMRLNFKDTAWSEVLDDIEGKMRAKLDEMALTIKVRQEEGVNAAIEIVRTNEGKKLMEEIQMTLLQINARESLIASMDTVQYRSVITEAVVGFSVSNVLVMGLIALGFFMVESRRKLLDDAMKAKIVIQSQLTALKEIEYGEINGSAAVSRLREVRSVIATATGV